MRKIIALVICGLFTSVAAPVFAQTVVNLTTPGTLKDVADIETVTDLTLTGTIDARDVAFMRDHIPNLAVLDLSGAAIAAYSGEGGTYPGGGYNDYPANTMPQYSFYNGNTGTGKTSLTSIVLPAGVTTIGYGAFVDCRGLTSITLPAGLTTIENEAFAACSGLTSITLPSGVTTIGRYTFYNCSGLTSITLPAGVTTIGDYAFEYCSGLTSITLPAGVTTIGNSAFYYCSRLTSITNLNPVPVAISSNVFTGVTQSACTLTVSSDAATAYQNAAVWNNFYISGSGVVFGVKHNAFGSITGTPGGLYAQGESISITAVPGDGFDFLGWSNGSNEPTLSFTLARDTVLTATFGKADTRNLTAVNTLKDVANIETVTHLTLTGAIDARDVAFMRDHIPNLAVLDLSGATIAAYSGEGGTYPWYDNYPANTMPQYSFYNNNTGTGKTSLTSITLPAGVTTIGNYAFASCSGLTSITLPAGITAIGSYAFQNCYGLTAITLPAGITAIGEWVFSNCSGLTSITLPAGVTTIGNYAFYFCSGLTSITLPAGVTTIGNYAFASCSGLTSITLPAGLTTIGNYAFSGCSDLTSVTLPAGLRAIGNEAFRYCYGLTAITSLNPTPVAISSGVFNGVNQSACTLTVPTGSATAYQNAAVWNNFYISGGGVVFSVQHNALGSITGTSNGLYAQNTAINITAVPGDGFTFLGWSNGSNEPTLSFTLARDTVLTATFGKADTRNLTAAGALKDVANIETVTHLTLTGAIDARDVAFMRDHIPNLTVLDLSGATIAAYGGENGTYPWGYDDYPANTMPQYSFYNGNTGTSKTSLTSIVLPAGITTIGNEAFSGCSGLTAITLPASLTTIGSWAFYNCSGLTSVTLPAGLTTIGERVFQSCSALTSITLPAGVTTIGSNAFAYCSGLTEIALPAGVTTIGNYTFSNCSGLTSISLPAGVTTIGEWVFQSCSALTSVTLPAGVTTIGYGAFYNCRGLTSITLPAGVTTIGDYAFAYCYGLTALTNLNPAPVAISSDVFYGVTQPACTLTVPTGSVAAYQGAAVWENFYINGGGVAFSVKHNALGSITGTSNGLYAQNTAINITAVPSTGFDFLGWANGDMTPTLSFTLARDTVLTASFGNADTQNLTAVNTLKDVANIETVTHLTLTGTIDARDVAFMRDHIPNLTVLDLSGATIAAYSGEGGTYPWGYDNYPANTMPQYSFYNNNAGGKKSLTSITLPAGVTAIGYDAFESCSGLTDIALPDGLTTIGSNAFANCSRLTAITLPAGLTTIEYSAFANCSGLTSIALPASVTTIGEWVFQSCSGLTAITLPAGLTTIGYDAFYYCSSLTSITNLNPTPVAISSDVFYGVNQPACTLTVPTGSVAAYQAAAVWENFYINGGGVAFGVKHNAFGSVTGTPDGLYPPSTAINITAVPSDGFTFLGWSNGDMTPTLSFTLARDTVLTATFGKVDTQNLTVAGALKDVANIETVTHFTLTGIIDARDVAFMRDSMPNLTALDLSGATVVAYSGESGTDPRGYDYPANTMPSYSFYNGYTGTGKTSLTSITLPAGVTTIGEQAFAACYGLTSVTLPAGLTTIGYGAFESCRSLTDIALPAGVTTIGNSAFVYCYGLTSITLPDGLTTIGNYAFQSCSGLTDISLPAGLTTIGYGAFYNCSGLTAITLPAGLTAIGEQAFASCYGLTSVTLPAGLTTIGYGAFASCYGLTAITLPAGLTTVGDYAFAYCYSLIDITNLNPTPVAIDSYVFNGIDQSASTLTVPSGSVATYQGAAVWRDFYISGGGVVFSVRHNTLGSVTGMPDGLYPQGTEVNITAVPAPGAEFMGWANGDMTPTLSFTLERDTVLTATFRKADTQNLTAAGTLKDVADIYTVSHLTLTGYIDARDVAFMRDHMPNLTVLDLSGATVVAYNGEGGTYPWGSSNYPANTMPQYSFYNSNTGSGKTSLTSITLPAGVTAIGYYAFRNCSGLTSITLPAGVTTIGDYAFGNCSGLTSMTLPAGLTTIGGQAFYYCYSLTSITLPAGVTTIGYGAFANCSGLTVLTSLNPAPVAISSEVFYGVNQPACTLTVSEGAEAAYRAAAVWKDFYISGSGVVFSVRHNTLGSVTGTPDGLYARNTEVSLTAAPAPGVDFLGWSNGNTALTLSFTLVRDTVLTAIFRKVDTQNLTAAGALKDVANIETVSHLTLTGYIDARDVAFMRDNMPSLTVLDLSGATVVAYSGEGGTRLGNYNYPANAMPLYSFYNGNTGGGKTSLTSITLPAGVTAIGNVAFAYCSGLTDITLSAGLTAIGSDAFWNCSKLASVTLPAGVTTIGDYAFENCYDLTDITLSAGLTTIGYGVFANCYGLTDISLPVGVTTIGSDAFWNCSGLIAITNLNPTPVAISSSVFYGVNQSACTLTVSEGAEAAYRAAAVWKDFYVSGSGILFGVKYNALGSVTGTPAGLYPPSTAINITAVPGDGFNFLGWSNGSKELTLSFTLARDTVLAATFGKVDTQNLTAAGALEDVADIETVSHLTLTGYIDARDVAFMRDSMPNLTVLDLSGATVVAYNGEGGTRPGNYDYPANAMPLYSFYDPYTGSGKTSLTSITLPAGLTAIGNYAFRNGTGLTSITLPSGVTTIGDYAFGNCSGLTDIAFPAGLTTIGYDAFYNCYSLTSIALPAGLTTIEAWAFENCTGLTSITLPAGLTTIGDYAFYYCSGLTSITLPAGLTTIGNYAFENCYGLTSITLPAGVTTIGYGAFAYCYSLIDITNLNPAPVAIDSYVFNGVNQPACTLTVPSGSVAAYQGAAVWENFYISGGGVVFSVQHNALGSITGTPNGLYPQGEEVSITAVPAPGAEFTGWSNGNTAPTLTFTLNQDTELTAIFAAIVYHITYELDGGTNHAGNPATYTVENEVVLQAPGKTGYIFKSWSPGNVIAKGSTGDKTFTAQWKSKIATLSSLTVSAGALTPAFNANAFTYTVSVDNNVESITVGATATDAAATVSGAGSYPLTTGDNEITITVTAEDETTVCRYTVVVERKNAPLIFTAFTLNRGNKTALYREVDLTYTLGGGSGVPTHFMVSERPDLSDATWQPYAPDALVYTFVSDEHGEKTVYTRLKNELGETDIRNASVYYKPLHEKPSLPGQSAVNVHVLTAKLFPNPVVNELQIIVEDTPAYPIQVTVYSITGTIYVSQQFNDAAFSIDLSRCTTGILLVKLSSGNSYMINQIVKL